VINWLTEIKQLFQKQAPAKHDPPGIDFVKGKRGESIARVLREAGDIK